MRNLAAIPYFSLFLTAASSLELRARDGYKDPPQGTCEPQTTYTMITPSPNAKPYPVTKQHQQITSCVPQYAVCYSGSTDCTTIYHTKTYDWCSTIIPCYGSACTITDCKQTVTYSHTQTHHLRSVECPTPGHYDYYGTKTYVPSPTKLYYVEPEATYWAASYDDYVKYQYQPEKLRDKCEVDIKTCQEAYPGRPLCYYASTIYQTITRTKPVHPSYQTYTEIVTKTIQHHTTQPTCYGDKCKEKYAGPSPTYPSNLPTYYPQKPDDKPPYKNDEKPSYGKDCPTKHPLENPRYPAKTPQYPAETPKYPVESPKYPGEVLKYTTGNPGKYPAGSPKYPSETLKYVATPLKYPASKYSIEGPQYPVETPKHPGEANRYPVKTPKYPAETPNKYPGATPKYPVETPKCPTETLKYPVASQYPTKTLKYPVESPKYPAEAPKYPAETPKYPAEAPKYPAESSKYPEEPAKYPTKTVKYPVETPKYPAENPQYPAKTPRYPIDIPKYPGEAPNYATKMLKYPAETPKYAAENPNYQEKNPKYAAEYPRCNGKDCSYPSHSYPIYPSATLAPYAPIPPIYTPNNPTHKPHQEKYPSQYPQHAYAAKEPVAHYPSQEYPSLSPPAAYAPSQHGHPSTYEPILKSKPYSQKEHKWTNVEVVAGNGDFIGDSQSEYEKEGHYGAAPNTKPKSPQYSPKQYSGYKPRPQSEYKPNPPYHNKPEPYSEYEKSRKDAEIVAGGGDYIADGESEHYKESHYRNKPALKPKPYSEYKPEPHSEYKAKPHSEYEYNWAKSEIVAGEGDFIKDSKSEGEKQKQYEGKPNIKPKSELEPEAASDREHKWKVAEVVTGVGDLISDITSGHEKEKHHEEGPPTKPNPPQPEHKPENPPQYKPKPHSEYEHKWINAETVAGNGDFIGDRKSKSQKEKHYDGRPVINPKPHSDSGAYNQGPNAHIPTTHVEFDHKWVNAKFVAGHGDFIGDAQSEQEKAKHHGSGTFRR